METDSQTKNLLEAQIRELYARTVWTHKTQEKCSDILRAKNHTFKTIQIVLSALTTTGIVITIFGNNYIVGIISAFLSAVLFALNAYLQKYDLGEIAQKHSEAAADIWSIREDYLSLLTDLKSEDIPTIQIRTQRDNLKNELYSVYKGAPRTLSKAYKKATEALNFKEELTFSEDEIDNLLPTSFRK